MSPVLTCVCRLDSRSRKKQYTKDLETDKKYYMEEIAAQKELIDKLTLQLNDLKLEREREYLQSQDVIRNLQYEREEIVARHTLESGDLRKRVSVLSEQLKNNTMPMSTVPSSAGFNDLGLGMESLNMCQDWEWMVDPNGMEPESTANVNSNGMSDMQPNTDMAPHPQETALVSSRKVEADKAVPTGLLFLLLLYGAFVASKSPSHSATQIRMPEDVRQASAHVLDNIFKDAGVSPASTSSSNSQVHRVSGFEPQASAGVSNTNWHQKSHTITGAEFARLSGPSSSLDSLHHDLTAPTKEQEAEQVFGMTPALYNSLTAPHHDLSNSLHSPPLTNEDTTSPSPNFGSSRRKLLAETLASMRESSRENAAQVYTRSLLWNEIPETVVQEFKRIVESSGSATDLGKDDGGGGGIRRGET